MANLYRGEVTASVAGLAYTLRPTFHILCGIEERTGLTLPQLLRRMAEKGLLASEILMLLTTATRHDGSRSFDPEQFLDMPADQVDLRSVMPALAKFLLGALGGADAESKVIGAKGAVAEGLDYGLLMEAAYRRLRLEPQAFWALTMPELRLLLGAMPRRVPPNRDEIRELMRQFPDRDEAPSPFCRHPRVGGDP